MAEDFEAQIAELYSQADDLPHGASRVSILEEAIRLADTHQSTEHSFYLRKALMEAATFGGYPEKALVAFTWCIAQCDKDPERFDPSEILWEYKWVIGSIKHFSAVPLARIQAGMDDMERRYQSGGYGIGPIHKLRCTFELSRGNWDEARKYQRLWKSAVPGWLNDCPACERDDKIDYLLCMGKPERAVEFAGPILSGRQSCAEVPHITYGTLLQPLLKLRRIEEAAQYHLIGYPMVQDGRDFLHTVSDHLSFLALTGNLDKAVAVFERHFDWMLETKVDGRKFEFILASRLLFEQLLRAQGTHLPLRLAKTFPLYQESGRYEVAELNTWFQSQGEEIAARFDARNQTTYYRQRLDEVLHSLDYATHYPLDR